MQDLRVTLVQDATVWRDAEANRALYGAHIASVAGRSDLVVLPETFTSGFSNDAVGEAETMQGATVAWLKAMAAMHDLCVAGSVVIRDGEKVFNRLLWAYPDGRISHYDKRHLFRMAGEHLRYASGADRLTVSLKGWRICPVVCYDLRFPVFLRNRFGVEQTDRFDYDLLVVTANWPAARRYAWQTLLRARAIENLACVAAVNRVGMDGNDLSYAGDSVALDPLGQVLIECGAQAQSVTVQFSAAGLLAHRERFPAQLDADSFLLE